jgi:hypothetical protein
MRVNAMVKNEEYAETRQEERFLQRLNGLVGVFERNEEATQRQIWEKKATQWPG